MKMVLVNSKVIKDRKYEAFNIGKYEVVVSTYTNGNKWVTVHIKDGGRYVPEIYCYDDFEGNIKSFNIQTTSYGALGVEDIQKVMEGYNEAIKVVEVLTKEFIK